MLGQVIFSPKSGTISSCDNWSPTDSSYVNWNILHTCILKKIVLPDISCHVACACGILGQARVMSLALKSPVLDLNESNFRDGEVSFAFLGKNSLSSVFQPYTFNQAADNRCCIAWPARCHVHLVLAFFQKLVDSVSERKKFILPFSVILLSNLSIRSWYR